MRFVSLLLLALAACYSPAGEGTCKVECSGPGSPCPGAMRCGDNNFCEKVGGETCGPGGVVIDAMPDPQLDAVVDGVDLDALVGGACVPAATYISDTSLVISGAWFVGDHFSQHAMMHDADGLLAFEGNFDQPGSVYKPPVTPVSGTVQYRAPRMSPGGMEMYLKVDVSGQISFGRSTWMGPDKWSQTNTVTFLDGNIPLGFSDIDNISPPTLTSPRHILVSSPNGYQELVESAGNPLVWKLALTVSAGTLFGVQFLGEATLSPDGMKMMFRGSGGGNITAYYVTRTDIDTAFGGVAIEIPHIPSNSVVTPFLSANCKHLYYTSSPAGDVHHVVLP